MSKEKQSKYILPLASFVVGLTFWGCAQRPVLTASRDRDLLWQCTFDGRSSFQDFDSQQTIVWGEVTNEEDRFGKNQSSMLFESSDARIDVTTADVLDSELSIFCWIKLARNPSDRSQHIINNGEKLGFLVRDKVGLRVVLSDNSGNRNASQSNTADNLTDNEWHYVGFTYDGDYLKLFIDGEISSVSRGAVMVGDLLRTFSIGNHVAEARPFGGYLDDMVVYKRAISQSEISKLLR